MKSLSEFFIVYKQAAWDKDINRMIELYDVNVTIFDMWVHPYQTGLNEWSKIISDWLGSLGDERVKVDFERIEVFEDNKVGFGSALISYQAISKENVVLRSMKNRITVGFVKSNGVWKVRHQHTSAPITAELEIILNF